MFVNEFLQFVNLHSEKTPKNPATPEEGLTRLQESRFSSISKSLNALRFQFGDQFFVTFFAKQSEHVFFVRFHTGLIERIDA